MVPYTRSALPDGTRASRFPGRDEGTRRLRPLRVGMAGNDCFPLLRPAVLPLVLCCACTYGLDVDNASTHRHGQGGQSGTQRC